MCLVVSGVTMVMEEEARYLHLALSYVGASAVISEGQKFKRLKK